MKEQLKIAIFSGTIPSATFIENVIEGVSRKYEVLLFGVQKKKVHYKSNQLKIYQTPATHFKNFVFSAYRCLILGFKSPKDLNLLFREIKKFSSVYDKWIWFTKFLPIVLYRPDILHIQWAGDIGFYFFLKEKFGCRIVVSLLGSHINYSPIANRSLAETYNKLFPKVDAFHAVSEAIALEAQKYGALASTITIIRSPIKPPVFERFRVADTIPKRIKVLSVGRHHWVKGYRYALNAIKILKERSFDVEYTIIAQGAVPQELNFQRHQLNLIEQVTFLKGIEQQALFKEMQGYDLLLLPSLNEGIANVVLEAMALGIPVISTDCGGMKEVVFPDETGWLVPVRDANSIAYAIITMSKTSDAERKRITQNAYTFVREHYIAEKGIKEFLELYERVASL